MLYHNKGHNHITLLMYSPQEFVRKEKRLSLLSSEKKDSRLRHGWRLLSTSRTQEPLVSIGQWSKP